MKKLFATSALLIASSAFAAGAPKLIGDWNIHNSIAGNESDQPCKFVLTENKLAGTCKSADDSSLLSTRQANQEHKAARSRATCIQPDYHARR